MKKLISALILTTPFSAMAANVVSQDQIVQGSQCVGVDCNNGMTFGFDTLVIKENNTRILFDDTSSSGSFPYYDWRLQANDSSNGGSNYFSIENVTNSKVPFKIDGGAGSNALIIDAQGDIGIGTSTPAMELQVTDGDSPTLRLEQDGSAGWTSQTWDIAGNETNFFIRDVTNSSDLPFRIMPGTGDDNLVLKGGKVGIMTDKPNHTVHVKSNTTDNSTPIFVVETTQSTEVDQSMMRLINANGESRIEMENKTTGVIWRITDDGGNFSFTKVGSGKKEFEVTSTGDLILTGEVTFGYSYQSGGQTYTGTTSLSDMLRRIHELEP